MVILMKKIKLNTLIFTLLLFLVIVFWGFLIYVNALPWKYLLIGLSVFIIWILIVGMLLFFKNNSKKNIIAYITSVFLVMIMVVIFFYLNSTFNFFKGLTSKYKEENYLVLVLKDSSYEQLSDLNNKSIGYTPNEISKINDALTQLKESIIIQDKEYIDSNQLMNDLLNKEIESVLIEKSFFDILDEQNKNAYSNSIRILYTINIKTKLDISKEIDVTKNTFSIYISGIDSHGKIANVARSDVNIVATINPKTKQILLVTIPRDYYVKLKGTTGLKDKLTHAGVYGIDTSVGTLEELLQVDINYYFRVNFSSLERIVDALDGVDVYSKYNFTSTIATGGTYRFTQGYNHMNGKQALAFSRERNRVPGGDRGRGINQQAVIDGLIRKATSSAIITKYSSLLKSLKDTFQSNMTEEDIFKLIKMQLNDMAKWTITSYSLDGKDENEYTYSTPYQKSYVMAPYEDTVNQAISLIDRVIEGEKLAASYNENATNVKTPTVVPPPVIEEPKPEEPDLPEEPKEPEEPVCDDECEAKKPKITLIGEGSITLDIGDTYIELGATAIDFEGNELEVLITGIEKIDTTKEGTFEITYTAIDSLDQTNITTIIRTIIVKEELSEIPPITE